jgi:ATP phosphoribosyltransferase
VRIASEYPNIADAVMRTMRASRYHVISVWGSADGYPPEDADLALIDAPDAAAVEAFGLRALARVLAGSACLIGNRESLAQKDLAPVLGSLLRAGAPCERRTLAAPSSLPFTVDASLARPRDRIRLALPDGHQQPHTFASLQAAGLTVVGYDERTSVRRPRINIDVVDVKVIRPQDMPQQVAMANFDLAITGRDRLFDHLAQFPASPVEEIVDLGRSPYGLAAIVKDVPADTIAGAVSHWRRTRPGLPIRIASEFPNIADHFARERRLGRYSVIPIAGASEGFVPDDAEILIEGIETGSSVRANKLTILERFFESTNIVIANKKRPQGDLRATFDALIERLRSGVSTVVAAGSV